MSFHNVIPILGIELGYLDIGMFPLQTALVCFHI